MTNVFNIKEEIDESIKDLDDYNAMLGISLMQPFKPANSGSRALMYSVHTQHLTVLNNSEVPIIQTGYENEFGRNSTSCIINDDDYKVLYKINKFENLNDHYFLIVQNIHTGEYDIVERVTYNYNTESYGYLWNNDKIDNLKVNDIIHKGDILKTSIGFDEYGNKMNGVNLTTMYLSCAQNMEDSVIISESAAKKLETSLVKNTPITINDNDILINLYGDENTYKTFPDIGEEVKNGIFCSIRRMENENILYTMSQHNLRDIMLSDRNILMEGKVADINVYCNNPEALGDSHYNSQLLYYYNQNLRFCKEIADIVGPLSMNSKLSYRLKKFYGRCRDVIAGKQFFKEKIFNHVIMEVTVIQNLPMNPGDKMSDRYGGKGVVSAVIPDNLMPKLDNGCTVEVIKNQSTCINRENIGQLHEQSLSFISMRLIDYLKEHYSEYSYTDMALLLYKFVKMVDVDFANYIFTSIDFYDEDQTRLLMESILEQDAILLNIQPFTTTINIDTIAKIYDEFDFIEPYKVKVPMKDSNGNIRMVNTLRPLVIGKIYHYRLKQYAEEKFSVTSLSATNLKNLNTRSKANKMYEAKFPKTPIMFGFMESGDMMHLGVQYVVMNLMLYSSSPQGRRLVEQLLIGDPYDIDIRLDKESKNRNAEIINALMETMGVELQFIKTLKEKKMMAGNVMCKIVPPSDFKPKTNIRDIMGRFDELPMLYEAALLDSKNKKMMAGNVMCKIVKDDENEDENNISETNTTES